MCPAIDATRLTKSHIPALDGLRALAVIGVLAFHDGRLDGGFLGVDLFFVLSGYLITRLLIDRMESGDAGTLRHFWTQRMRRLLPAVLVLIAVVVLVFRLFADPGEWILARRDAPWAQFYGANWHHIWLGTDYWDQFASPSPFEHLWSLAIEEQFYLVWPIVIFVIMKQRRTWLIAPICLAGIVGSTMSMWIVSGTSPTHAYMGTDTRASSLLIGALLATPHVHRVCVSLIQRHKQGATLLGCIILAALGIMWSAVDGDDVALFHGEILSHSLLAGLLLLVVAHTSGSLARVLGFAPLTYIGRLSYGLYLWHWPIYVFLSANRTGMDGWSLTGLRFAVTLAFSAVSYHLIEYPIRFRATWARQRRGAVALIVATSVTALSWLVISVPATTNAVDADALATFVTTPPATTPIETTTDVVPRWTGLDETQVYYFGDSIASDMWPAIRAGFAATGLAIESGAFGGVGLISSNDPSQHLGALAERLDVHRPRLLIVQLSIWDAERPASEQIDALKALQTLTTERDLRTVIVSFPSLAPNRVKPGQALLEMRARDLALASSGTIAYLDQRPALGQVFSFDIDGDGVPERKRDGIHVCPTGALIVTQWLLNQMQMLVPSIPTVSAETWAFGSWRSDDRYDSPPGACASL